MKTFFAFCLGVACCSATVVSAEAQQREVRKVISTPSGYTVKKISTLKHRHSDRHRSHGHQHSQRQHAHTKKRFQPHSHQRHSHQRHSVKKYTRKRYSTHHHHRRCGHYDDRIGKYIVGGVILGAIGNSLLNDHRSHHQDRRHEEVTRYVRNRYGECFRLETRYGRDERISVPAYKCD